MSFRATETDSRREPKTEGLRLFLGYLIEVATDPEPEYLPTTDRTLATHVHAQLSDGDIHVVPIGEDTGGVHARFIGDTLVIYGATPIPPPDPDPDPEWPVVDADVEVFPGDDLATIINAAPAGSDIYLHRNLDGTAYAYDLTAPLSPAGGVTVRAATPATSLIDAARDVWAVTPWVDIDANGAHYVLDLVGVSNPTFENVHLRGARYSGTGNSTGVGVRGGTNVTLNWCKISDCDNQGAGQSWQGTMNHVEITDCGGALVGGASGTSAAAKSPQACTYVSCYVHDNHYYGLWADCDNAGWTVTNCYIVDTFGSGLFYEISRGTATITNCYVARNNLSNVAGRGGMIVTSAKNVTLDGVEFDGNLQQNLRIWEDSRFQNGPNSCSSGYYLENVVVQNCSRISGPTFRLVFNGQSTIQVTADATYPNPHLSAPAGAEVVFSGNSY